MNQTTLGLIRASNLQGRDLIDRYSGLPPCYRGPITGVKFDRDYITLQRGWTAVSEQENEPWKLCQPTPCGMAIEDSSAEIKPDGTIFIDTPIAGMSFVILPVGDNLSKPT